jgi:hypothetical protein
MSYALGRSYGADIEAHWYIARYVLPGNVQKVILKPRQFEILSADDGTSSGHERSTIR